MSLRPHLISAIQRALVGGLLSAALMAGLVSAQSLGEVARQEEARRKSAPAGKVYTNDTLRADFTIPTPPPTAAGGAAAAPADGSKAEPKADAKADDKADAKADAKAEPKADAKADAKAETKPDAKGDEDTWRKRAQGARDALGRSQMFADALQSRINGLTADFAARDDPAQRSVVAADRQKALGELDRVKKEIEAQTKALADLQEEARKNNVPPGWLR